MPGWGVVLLKGARATARIRVGGRSWQQRGTAASQLCEREHGHQIDRNSSALLSQPHPAAASSLGTSEQQRHWATTAGPVKATLVFGGWSTLPCEEGLQGWSLYTLKKRGLLGVLTAAPQHHKVIKNMGPGSPPHAWWVVEKKRSTSQKGGGGWAKIILFHNPAVTQVAQGDCAFSFLGSFSRSTALTLHVALL